MLELHFSSALCFYINIENHIIQKSYFIFSLQNC